MSDPTPFKTADRLKRAIAINLVIGWRIMLMSLLGRELPELPATVIFSDQEIEVFKAYTKKKDKSPKLYRSIHKTNCKNRRLPGALP